MMRLRTSGEHFVYPLAALLATAIAAWVIAAVDDHIMPELWRSAAIYAALIVTALFATAQ